MKKLIILTFLLSVCILNNTSAQQSTIQYDYDDSGNRISRNKIAMRLAYPEDTSQNNTISKYGVNVFPNPAKEQINVLLSNFKDGDEAAVFLYDIQGKNIFNKKQVTSQESIDLLQFASGIYHLKIIINSKEQLEYKIQKY